MIVTDDAPAFSAVLARMLRERGWRQSDLAAASGLTASYISMILAGDRGRRPSLATVEAICIALDVSDEEQEELHRAAGYLRPPPSLPLTMEEFLARDRSLTQDGRDAILAAYNALRRRER